MTHFFHPHPAHPSPVHIGNRPTILFVTISTEKRAKLLANPQAHQALINIWAQTDHWVVGYYLIMPDHIHLFCAPSGLTHQPIRQWCGYWKRIVGKVYSPLHKALKKDCWDTQMRDGAHYTRKLSYVANNPVRANLVPCNLDWPFQGNINPLPWVSGT